MKNFLYVVLCGVLISVVVQAQTMHSGKAAANPKFSALCDQFVKESLALSPVGASQAGYHKHIDPKTGKTSPSTPNSTISALLPLPSR